MNPSIDHRRRATYPSVTSPPSCTSSASTVPPEPWPWSYSRQELSQKLSTSFTDKPYDELVKERDESMERMNRSLRRLSLRLRKERTTPLSQSDFGSLNSSFQGSPPNHFSHNQSFSSTSSAESRRPKLGIRKSAFSRSLDLSYGADADSDSNDHIELPTPTKDLMRAQNQDLSFCCF